MLNEKFHTLLMSLVSVVIVYFASRIDIPAIRIFASSLQSLALWQFFNVSFIIFLYGVKKDVMKEIFEERNTALALMVGLFAIGSAITIHG